MVYIKFIEYEKNHTTENHVKWDKKQVIFLKKYGMNQNWKNEVLM